MESTSGSRKIFIEKCKSLEKSKFDLLRYKPQSVQIDAALDKNLNEVYARFNFYLLYSELQESVLKTI